MLRRILYKNGKSNDPIDQVVELIEDDKDFVYAKRLEDDEPMLIKRGNIIEIEKIKDKR
jgi:hypothetical protein